jgi:hypothetical protein
MVFEFKCKAFPLNSIFAKHKDLHGPKSLERCKAFYDGGQIIFPRLCCVSEVIFVKNRTENMAVVGFVLSKVLCRKTVNYDCRR